MKMSILVIKLFLKKEKLKNENEWNENVFSLPLDILSIRKETKFKL
jgi:hypothetical protein